MLLWNIPQHRLFSVRKPAMPIKEEQSQQFLGKYADEGSGLELTKD